VKAASADFSSGSALTVLTASPGNLREHADDRQRDDRTGQQCGPPIFG